MENERDVLKKIFDGDSVSVNCQIDLLLHDIISQLQAILDEQGEEVKIMKTLALKQYVKGYRDGFRLMKSNPYPNKEVVNSVM